MAALEGTPSTAAPEFHQSNARYDVPELDPSSQQPTVSPPVQPQRTAELTGRGGTEKQVGKAAAPRMGLELEEGMYSVAALRADRGTQQAPIDQSVI